MIINKINSNKKIKIKSKISKKKKTKYEVLIKKINLKIILKKT